MLSNPTNNLHNRQRQHRRQNSTPNAFEPVKVSNLPNIQRHGGHRRGMSLDTRRRQTPPQDYMVSNTNPGFQTTQQHTLRETQQQRLVRPGQHFAPFDNDENYLNSPNVTPQRQSFDAGCMNNQYGDRGVGQSQYYSGPINTIIPVDSSNFSGDNDFNLFEPQNPMTPSEFLDFSAGFDGSQASNSGNHSRRSSAGRRISGGIMERVSQFENMALQSPVRHQRPSTPPNQNVASYFPPTPVDTPHDRMIKHEQMNPRFLDTYDTSMEETIKPKSNQRARSIFDDMRKEAEMSYMPSPPRSGQMPTTSSFDSAPIPSGNYLNLSNTNLDFLKNEQQNDQLQYSPVSSNMSSHLSYNSSPEAPQMAMFDPFVSQPKLEAAPMSFVPEASAHGLSVADSPTRMSHRRSESVQSIQSACSINLEEAVTDTGITIDDIATFIQGPDPIDGKWLCLYTDCKKRFGRKENIKSHVQTHLGDRQYQCPHCKKCFVRQHDLKRHAKIHSGVKPYPCQCGNSFARHDALTRHRQRGMCIGAFEGVVKKTVKRGRPRKNRPDNEDRLAKSSRTRSKNKAMSSSSSTTSCSDSGDGQSPRSEADVLDDKPFGDYDFTQSTGGMSGGSFEFSQPQSPGPAHVSPQAIQAHSPSAFSQHSHHSSQHRGSISESIHLPSYPASPAKSVHSYHSPPGLCESSSSPAASQHYYDIETSSHHGDQDQMTLDNLTGLANISEHDDEMFLEAFAAASNGEMTSLERDPDMLMGKFDDSFTNMGGEDPFRSSVDAEALFFGSP
ncbi:related to gastrula zinc finger protein XlCGF17.1 [Phialocephala subalpina]|uniref:Related to gastrula zinc finger protein XlCGF17.1 n=1 Tax=Phialocephala subalpina TaxID=576137 RepID=A0A1L7XH66_9HELO|nr:related to gastrula zinc finger protein XlCGF17.1 [Phialocephala subalpina]